MRIRTLLIDDEPLARRRLRAFLRTAPDFEICGEASNGEEAVEAVKRLQPSVIFLDVQMPGMTGFEMLDQLSTGRTPCLIFVTAFDEYALKAFDARATDYLLKPFSRERFEQTLDRVREQLERPHESALRSEISRLITGAPKSGGQLVRRIAIRVGTKTLVLPSNTIERVEAERDYIRIITLKETHLTRETMNRFETRVSADEFVRIHRSTIINVNSIVEIHPLLAGDFTILLRSGTYVTLSRGYRERLENCLGQSL